MLGGICVSKQKRLKKQLGTGYQFEQRFSAKNLARMLQWLEGSNHFRVAAILSAGAVRLEAVVYWDNGKYSLGYDLLVKDTPFSPDWICYGMPKETTSIIREISKKSFLSKCPSVTPWMGKPLLLRHLPVKAAM